MQLSIIIVNYNTPHMTKACIESVVNHTVNLNYEIILVDNSHEEEHEKVFRGLSDRLRYFQSSENLGFGRANNLGMSQAQGEYLLLLNSDTLFTSNAILECVRFLDSPEGKDADVLGIRLQNPDGSYQSSFYPYTRNNFFHYFVSSNPLLYRVFGVAKDYREPEEIKRVGDVIGAFFLLRRKVYEDTGGFDPDFFLYYEESEWCRGRIRKNFRIYYLPSVSVIHIGGQSGSAEMRTIQAMVSYGLLWYKLGRVKFGAFIIINMFNYLLYFISYPFVSGSRKKALRENMRVLKASIPYWLKEIPRYSARWGSRPFPLKYREPDHQFTRA